MDPQQNLPLQPNQYDFLNSQPAKNKSPFSGGSQKQKTLIFILFLLFVTTVIVTALVVFRQITKKDYSLYKQLLQQQTEIIRIADAGTTKAKDISVKNYSATLATVTKSEKNDTLAYLNLANVKINTKILDATKDANNDKLLSSAEANNQYDAKLTELLNSLVSAYQKDINSASVSSASKTEKALVIKLQNNAKILVGTAPKP
ncbi:hypothetical protein EB118_03830 [bacterium]|nr:hypothetical protein [bacterium]NBX97348.1 hypothetical protein [bacterium]NDC94780.1 hypothetical protein [bacterium]NDD84521.1 hypothetical protein [bacterium]NDG29215.1 hypothetical protein [bacterium]